MMKILKNCTKTKNRGFTLIELLVAIAIIGVLSTLAVAGVNRAREKAKITKSLHELSVVRRAIEIFANDVGEWPGHNDINYSGSGSNNEVCPDGCAFGLFDVEAGLTGTDGTYFGWNGPYLNEVLVDAWENEYFFDNDYYVDVDNEPCGGTGAGCFRVAALGSYGPNGEGNNDYDSDDVIKIMISE